MCFVVIGFKKLVIENNGNVRAIHRSGEIEILFLPLLNDVTPFLHRNELENVGMGPRKTSPNGGASASSLLRETTGLVHDLHKATGAATVASEPAYNRVFRPDVRVDHSDTAPRHEGIKNFSR